MARLRTHVSLVAVLLGAAAACTTFSGSDAPETPAGDAGAADGGPRNAVDGDAAVVFDDAATGEGYDTDTCTKLWNASHFAVSFTWAPDAGRTRRGSCRLCTQTGDLARVTRTFKPPQARYTANL